VICSDASIDHCISPRTKKELKYSKTIYVFTDAESPIDDDGFDAVAKQIHDREFDLVLW
jgi:hypothetical protein